MLTLLVSTASFAQTGKTAVIDGDTCQCYNKPELERIATRIVYANECDTLYNICESQRAALDTAIVALQNEVAAKDSTIAAKDDIIILKEDIIIGKDQEITGLRDVLKKESRKLKWTKIGWAGTSVVFTGIIFALILK